MDTLKSEERANFPHKDCLIKFHECDRSHSAATRRLFFYGRVKEDMTSSADIATLSETVTGAYNATRAREVLTSASEAGKQVGGRVAGVAGAAAGHLAHHAKTAGAHVAVAAGEAAQRVGDHLSDTGDHLMRHESPFQFLFTIVLVFAVVVLFILSVTGFVVNIAEFFKKGLNWPSLFGYNSKSSIPIFVLVLNFLTLVLIMDNHLQASEEITCASVTGLLSGAKWSLIVFLVFFTLLYTVLNIYKGDAEDSTPNQILTAIDDLGLICPQLFMYALEGSIAFAALYMLGAPGLWSFISRFLSLVHK